MCIGLTIASYPEFDHFMAGCGVIDSNAASCNAHCLQVLQEVLRSAGVGETEKLIKMADSESVKKQLFANTTRYHYLFGECCHLWYTLALFTFRAVEEGLCGVPSFRVNDGPVIWGQDRYNVVADMLCGWEDRVAAKL